MTSKVLFLFVFTLFGQADHQTVRPSIERDVEAAQRLATSVDDCRAERLAPIRELIQRYGHRREPELRLIVARGRLATAGGFRFTSRLHQARRWYISVVRIYGNEQGIEFRRLVAFARFSLARMVRGRNARLRQLSDLMSDLADAEDPELLHTYHRALTDTVGLFEERGDEARASELRRQANELWQSRIRPLLPPPNGDEPICV